MSERGTCESCKWWEYPGSYNVPVGECRLKPPVVCVATQWWPTWFPYTKPRLWTANFPIVKADHWCGEHQPREREDG